MYMEYKYQSPIFSAILGSSLLTATKVYCSCLDVNIKTAVVKTDASIIVL